MPRVITTTDGTWVDFSDEITQGAAFLDEVAFGWESRIDPEVLDLYEPKRCVLGQVFGGHYLAGCHLLGKHRDDGDPVNYGFCIGDGVVGGVHDWTDVYTVLGDMGEQPVWSALTEQWLHFINDRLAKETA
jgi:hypothetical protein